MPNCLATILVVDDDADVRDAVSSALEDESYRVVMARDGVEALELVKRGPMPQLIVLDLTMPRMTGAEFQRRLLAELPHRQVPVVVMSADVEGRAKARNMGASAFLQKPVRLKELFRVVERFRHSRDGEVEPTA